MMFFPIPLEFKRLEDKRGIPVSNAGLILLNVIVYLFGWECPAGPGASPASVLMYGFCHLGSWHLVLNMWVLWVFGNPVNRRLGNGLYLFVYLGCILVVGVVSRLVLPVSLVGASGGIFAIITIALILMPTAMIESAYVAIFPLTILLGIYSRPKYELNWFLNWGIVTVPAWWCILLIPFMELVSICWRGWFFGWISCWTPGIHLLGVVCGVIAVLMLPLKITCRSTEAFI
jgi:membrane associated rhomboid family serine protease